MSRRLFEQTENANPALTKRLAFGKASEVTENITLTDFIAWLMTKLGFLKTANNLSDLANASTARDNLGVYSETEVDSLLSTKAELYPEAGGALGSTNTTVFNPAANYHPATKKYVDDKLLDTGWINCINSLSNPTFSIQARQIGKIVSIAGDMLLRNDPAGTIFVIPSSVAAPTKNIGVVCYAAGNDYYIINVDAGSRDVQLIAQSGMNSVNPVTLTYFV